MLYFLDSNIVIYAVEGQPPFQQRTRDHIAALENAGYRFVVSELTWTECLVLPLAGRRRTPVAGLSPLLPWAALDHGSLDGSGSPKGGDDPGNPPLRAGGFTALGRRRGASP